MRVRRLLAGVLCVFAVGAAPAQAAYPEPDLIIRPHELTPPPSLPQVDLQSPCGLAVDSSGNILVANYYRRAVEAFQPTPKLLSRFELGSSSGPCGLAVGAGGSVYVNNYHRNVERFTPATLPLTPSTSYVAHGPIDSAHPTGVAADSSTGTVYVNARTYIAAYNASGAPLMDEGEPLRIGQGSLGDGYGIAVSAHPATAGYLYVPDHADDTVKVYDPTVDVDDPVQTIDGADIPGGGFGSLRDSAVALDRVTGEVYVADTRAYPQHTEYPEAVIRVFDAAGTYKGRLKYAVIDGSPVGLAVDNTVGPTQGRVYVTSGNTAQAFVLVYPPGSATIQGAPPWTGITPSAPGGSSGSSGGPAVASDPAPSASAQGAPLSVQPRSARAGSSVIEQRGNLRVTVEGRLAPKRLPRKGSAPIKVSVGGQIATTDQSLPPQLRTLQIELNRHGRLERRGLPSCRYEQIQPGSSKRALSACRSSLVGTGSFKANIILAGQEPYPSQGRLLVFNATERGKPVLYGHIHTDRPFATSFVIVFELREKQKGRYGTTLHARIPRSMDSWGRLTALEMTLGRTYRAKGKRRAYISAGCPAPKGFPGTLFPLARTTFAFKDGKRIASTLISECKARR